MVAHTVYLVCDAPQEVFYIIAGILDTVALKRKASRAHGCHRETTRSVASCSRTVIVESCKPIRCIGGTREGARCQGDLRRGQDHGLLEKDAVAIFDNLPSCHEDEAILEIPLKILAALFRQRVKFELYWYVHGHSPLAIPPSKLLSNIACSL